MSKLTVMGGEEEMTTVQKRVCVELRFPSTFSS